MSGNRIRPEPGAQMRYLRPLLWGIAASCLICAILFLLLAGLISWHDVPMQFIDPLVVLTVAFSCFTGAYLCARMTREKGMMLGFAGSGALFLLLLLCSLPISGVEFSMLLVIKLLSMLLCGALGGILGVNRRIRHK